MCISARRTRAQAAEGRRRMRARGRLEFRRKFRAEFVLLGLGGSQMPRLDVAEAADFFRDAGQADREMMVFRR